MRRYLNFAVVSAAAFLILLTWAAPRMLLWYGTPPFAVPYNCNQAITWSTGRLIETQTYGSLGGALVGLALCFWWNRRAARKALAAAPTTPAAPPPSTPAAKA